MFVVGKQAKAAWIGVCIGVALGAVLVSVFTSDDLLPLLTFTKTLWPRLASMTFSLSLPLLTALLLGSGLIGAYLGWRSERQQHLRLLKEIRDSLAEAREESRTAWTVWAKRTARRAPARPATSVREGDEDVVTAQVRVIELKDGFSSAAAQNGERKD